MLRSRAERLALAALLVLGCGSGHEIPRPRAVRERPGAGPPTSSTEPEPEPESETEPEPESPSARKLACLDAELPGVEPGLEPFVRSLCAHYVDRELPGLAVALLEDDAVILHVELGRRCSDRSEPVGPDTVFRIGSITKPITAGLVLEHIVAAQPERLEQPVVLEGLAWPAGMSAPTLDALLRHRSGLGEVDPTALLATGGDWKRALAHSPRGGQPGQWHYSNAGYVILGALLEAHTARDYEQLVRARVGEGSTLTTDLARPSELACGHLRYGGGMHPVPVAHDLALVPGDTRWLRSAGGVLGSAEDLARYAAKQLGPLVDQSSDPLPPDAWRQTGHDERYGMGLRSWTLDSGLRVVGHAGDTGTFSAELLVVPERELALVLLANAEVDWKGPLGAFETWLGE